MDSIEAAGCAVAALLDGGVAHVVVAPGSRSAPLAYALAAAEADGAVRLHVRIDERDAGFTALGLAMVSGRPVAVITTSGTAVGNLMPAVMEANHSAIPLVVVSADRPGELRGTGANQTTRQAGLFGTAVRYDVDIPAGADPTDSVATGIAAALGAGPSSLAGVRGPVQLNVALRDPLTPVLEPGSAGKLPPGAPEPNRQEGTRISGGRTGQDEPGISGGRTRQNEPAAGDVPARREATRREGAGQPKVSGEPGRVVESRDGSDRVTLRTPAAEHRTVVVAGAGAGAGAELFASLLRLPLFADPTSNARHGANAVGPYRLLLEHLGQDIERVVLFGRPTLSRQVAALLARTDVETVFYEPEPVPWYEAGRRRERPIATRDELADFAGTGPAGWLVSWQEAADRAEAALDRALAREPVVTGLQVARSLWADTTRRNARLVVGSSNPVRDLDLAARPAERSWAGVFANRGIAGIDGTMATATGIALAEPERETRLLLGDLTLLHDVGGLFLGSGEASPNLQIIVLNDAGGGIFSLLEHGQLGESEQYRESVERLFGTPHTVDISGLAQAYGVRYRLAGTAVELEGALAERIRGRSIIEVRTERAGLRDLHQRIKDAIQAALA